MFFSSFFLITKVSLNFRILTKMAIKRYSVITWIESLINEFYEDSLTAFSKSNESPMSSLFHESFTPLHIIGNTRPNLAYEPLEFMKSLLQSVQRHVFSWKFFYIWCCSCKEEIKETRRTSYELCLGIIMLVSPAQLAWIIMNSKIDSTMMGESHSPWL